MSGKGWICPSCKRGIAPGEKTCDHGGALIGLAGCKPFADQNEMYRKMYEAAKPKGWSSGCLAEKADPGVMLWNGAEGSNGQAFQ